MEKVLYTAQIVSALAFIFYGVSCVFSNGMVDEFKRFGLAKFRRITGVFEILGGLGLLVGFYSQPILLLSSLGLSVLMFLGIITRVRIKDPLIDCLPAIVLFLINLGIVSSFYFKS